MKPIMTPERRAELIAKLQLAQDDPRVGPQLRKRLERSTRNMLAVQRAET